MRYFTQRCSSASKPPMSTALRPLEREAGAPRGRARALRPRRHPHEPPAREPAPRRRARRSDRAARRARRCATRGGPSGGLVMMRVTPVGRRVERVLLLEAGARGRPRRGSRAPTASARGSMSLPKSTRDGPEQRALHELGARAHERVPDDVVLAQPRRRARARPRSWDARPRGRPHGATRSADRPARAARSPARRRRSLPRDDKLPGRRGGIVDELRRAATRWHATRPRSPHAGGRLRPTRCGSERRPRSTSRRSPRAASLVAARAMVSESGFALAARLGRHEEAERQHRARGKQRVDRPGEARSHATRPRVRTSTTAATAAQLVGEQVLEPAARESAENATGRRGERDGVHPSALGTRSRPLDHRPRPVGDPRELGVVERATPRGEEGARARSDLAERRGDRAAHRRPRVAVPRGEERLFDLRHARRDRARSPRCDAILGSASSRACEQGLDGRRLGCESTDRLDDVRPQRRPRLPQPRTKRRERRRPDAPDGSRRRP